MLHTVQLAERTVFRAGEQGRFWYAVLGGSLEVRYHSTDTETKVRIVLVLLYKIYIVLLIRFILVHINFKSRRSVCVCASAFL